MKTYMRPYSLPKASKKRPSRPRPASSSSSSASANRLEVRQRAGDGEGSDDSWQAAAVDELTKLEEEMLEKGAGTFSPAVEPDDGSNVVVDPSPDDDFDLEAQSNLFLPKPIVLPTGPTRSHPLEAKPNAMVFFHIPLQQAYTAEVDVGPSGRQRLLVGERLEGAGASKTDSGFFDQAILAQGELLASPSRGEGGTHIVDEFWDGESAAPTEGRPEVKVLSHGHCHLSSDCRRVKGVWQCFGGGGTVSFFLFFLLIVSCVSLEVLCSLPSLGRQADPVL